MGTSTLSEPITRPEALLELVRLLSQQAIVGVDTESNSLFAYQEQVCLIQFSTTEADYLVDPLALADLTPLGVVFADPKIEKVFHAAEYDLLCLKRDFGFSFANLFDTMLAGRILGRKEVGLGAMLEAFYGVQADKRQQRANWGQRPLPAPLLAYASLDTHYLIPLRDRLEVELNEAGLLPLAQEDFQRLCQAESGVHDERRETFWRLSGAHDLTPQQAAVLYELHKYREQAAHLQDRPLFKVMGNQTLVALAGACPASLDDLRGLPGMSHHQIRQHGRAILQAVQKGLAAEPLYPPRQPRPDERYLARLDALREWRKLKAREMGVESDVVLPRDLLYRLASENPFKPQELQAVLHDSPWRLEHFGEQIMEILDSRR